MVDVVLLIRPLSVQWVENSSGIRQTNIICLYSFSYWIELNTRFGCELRLLTKCFLCSDLNLYSSRPHCSGT